MEIFPNKEGGVDVHFGRPGNQPARDAILESATYTDRSGVKSILYRLNQYVPVRSAEGKAVFFSMPLSQNIWLEYVSKGPTPTNLKVVLLHPDNYISFSDLCASQKIALKEWLPREDAHGE